MIEPIHGGVTAAAGFSAGGIHCGIRKNKTKKDLALIVSSVPAAAACVYTQNKVQGAPIAVTKAHMRSGYARAVLCNSGNANTCNADGVAIAEAMCVLAAGAVGCAPEEIVVASTGVIGQLLPLAPIETGMPALAAALRSDAQGSDDAAAAIMTTDLKKKEVAFSFELDGVPCRIGGIAKGSGMIHPNMATMLVFITTDAAIAPEMLQAALSADVCDTFNMISVDGDTSTNDMVAVLANGCAGNPAIAAPGEAFDRFAAALRRVTETLCIAIAADGEGATKLLTCHVTGADTQDDARRIARSVIASPLVKTAMFGADANWGRILCAAGYADAKTDPSNADVSFGAGGETVTVCRNGGSVVFSEEDAARILSSDTVQIDIALHSGNGAATAWGCDMSYDYVKINGDYRT